MAAYETVSWQPGDEVTSQKLQQMASNDTYLHGTKVQGDIEYQLSNVGKAPAGREAGIDQAKRVCAVRVDFDTQVAVDHHQLVVPIQNLGFTKPPVIAISHFTVFVWSVALIFEADRVDKFKVLIRESTGRQARLMGNLHAVLVGV